MRIFPTHIIVLFTAFSLATHAVSFAPEGASLGNWTQDLEAAKVLAKEKNLPLFLNFTGSDWCGWCIRTDESVFEKEEWKDFAKEKLVLVAIDFPQDKSKVPADFRNRNQQLQEEFGVSGYPTFVLLGSDGNTKLGSFGTSQEATPETFIKQIRDILKYSPDSIAALSKKMGEKGMLYTAAVKSMKQQQSDFESWMESMRGKQQVTDDDKEKFQRMQNDILEATNKVEDLEAGYVASVLPDEKSKQFIAARKAVTELRAELVAWLSSNPSENEENLKKFTKMRDDLNAKRAEADQLAQEVLDI